jgi:hypothetical protein
MVYRMREVRMALSHPDQDENEEVLMSLFPLFLKRQCQLKPGSRSGRELG